MPLVVVAVGLARSGKDTFADCLVGKYGFRKYVFSDVLRRELQKHGKEATKPAMAALGDELRARHGPDIVARRLLETANLKQNAVLVGARTPEEIGYVRKAAGNVVVVRVDAPKGTRYERRSGIDAQKIKEFFMRDAEDIANKRMDKALEAADFVIKNSGTLPEFKKKIGKLMEKVSESVDSEICKIHRFCNISKV